MTDTSNAAMTSTPEQMTMKPCAKCQGSGAQLFANEGWYAVECEDCSSKTRSSHRSPAAAVAEWNNDPSRRSLSEGQKPVAWLGYHPETNDTGTTECSTVAEQWERDGVEVTPLCASPVSQPEQKPVAVKPLDWATPPGADTLKRADSILGEYRTWTYHGAEAEWFWDLRQPGGGIVARGQGDTEDFVRTTAETYDETRIRSALVDAPAVAVKDDTSQREGFIDWLVAHYGKVGVTPALRNAYEDYRALARPIEAEPVERGEAVIEVAAKLIYEAFPFNGDPHHMTKPAWVEHGNSNMQELARRTAISVLSLAHPAPVSPAGTDEKRIAELVKAAEELADIVDAATNGEYGIDSFTTQPLRTALSRSPAPDRMETWQPWVGSERPPNGIAPAPEAATYKLVDWKLRNGGIGKGKDPETGFWHHDGGADDIVAWRLSALNKEEGK